MSFEKKLDFANYTLNFGENQVLLDLFDEIVMPSFLEMRYKRIFKNGGEYFFIDTQLIDLGADGEKPILAIVGRIIKNTMLKRHQIFSNSELVADTKELESAPSSIFLLILNNHRLILCREFPNAPTLKNFQSTSQSFLKSRYKEFIREKFQEAKKLEEAQDIKPEKKITYKLLYEQTPSPELRVTPLSDNDDLAHFIARFQVIENVTIKLLATNSETINNDEFWLDLQKRNENIDSTNTSINFSNRKTGLKSDVVFEQSSSASLLGNSEVILNGIDTDGSKLKGTNDDFSLSVPIADFGGDIVSTARIFYDKFIELLSKKTIGNYILDWTGIKAYNLAIS